MIEGTGTDGTSGTGGTFKTNEITTITSASVSRPAFQGDCSVPFTPESSVSIAINKGALGFDSKSARQQFNQPCALVGYASDSAKQMRIISLRRVRHGKTKYSLSTQGY
jgi:hypothetical protein